jgi:hypothetical protein
MVESMTPPEVETSRDSLRGTKIARLVMDVLGERDCFTERRFFAIMQRLVRAQK